MKYKYLLHHFFLVILMIVFIECCLRIALFSLGYPFIEPSKYIFHHYYPDVKELADKKIRNDDDVVDILLLGGSVISSPWSRMEERLKCLLESHFIEGKKVVVYNLAKAAHTSVDNRLKYELLSNQKFDLVVYYEAINENRANNVKLEAFRDGYLHIKWFRDIFLLRRHPEIDLTVIPFVLDNVWSLLSDIVNQRSYMSLDQVNRLSFNYGGVIKTKATYARNLEKIIFIARDRKDPLLLLNYASYFPEGILLSGEEDEFVHFAGCKFASKSSIWGKASNIKKGIEVHNQVLKGLALKHKIQFFDMSEAMPDSSYLFCDICHLSEPGAELFARRLSAAIIDKKLLTKSY